VARLPRGRRPAQLLTAIAGRRRAGPFTPRSLAKVLGRLGRLGRLAGVGPVRPHGLRHTAITAALDAGHDVRAVRRFRQHAKLETVDRYDDNRRDVARQISGAVSDMV
jgi:integrase/recombinase XerC